MTKLLKREFASYGIAPVFREMVEILLVATHKTIVCYGTFAVGINMPTKAVVFSSLTKYDGNNGYLHSHEYSQIGRAGRRGKDTKYVFHLNGLFKYNQKNQVH